jgi:N-acetylglucosaminyl-diphospho-decaprenol L-rhamnosyltransferase
VGEPRSTPHERIERADSPHAGKSRVTAIVVYFRTRECLTGCLDALREQTLPADEIVVVDNSSALDNSDQRPAPGEDWTWVRATRNLGYGTACNRAAQMTTGEYVLFLNADVMLDPTACMQLRLAADSQLRTAVVGPRIYGADGSIELSARAFPTVATGLLGRSSRVTKMLARIGRTPAAVSGALGSGGPVDWVSGACMLVRRQAFEQVRGFDEQYWMYWEDADICRRLKDRGWGTMLCPQAAAHHMTGSSGRSARTIIAFHASAARYYERHIARTAMSARAARVVLRARGSVILRRYDRRPD